jgi:hypothetical protein
VTSSVTSNVIFLALIISWYFNVFSIYIIARGPRGSAIVLVGRGGFKVRQLSQVTKLDLSLNVKIRRISFFLLSKSAPMVFESEGRIYITQCGSRRMHRAGRDRPRAPSAGGNVAYNKIN